MFHPASLLLAWAGMVLVLPVLSPAILASLLVPVLLGAILFARSRTLTLFRRARWLLVSIVVLFAFATPGVALPPPWAGLGLTWDGLQLAAEHVARLILLLASLSVLHEFLGTEGIVSGLYWLIGPLAGRHGLRERIVVRVMLVVEFVESGSGGWREWLSDSDVGPHSLSLGLRAWHWQDWVVLLAVVLGVTTALTW